MNYKVYKIYRTDTDETVYIGITKNSISKRISAHFSDQRRNKKKINYFNKYRHLLDYDIIEEGISTLDEANTKEIKYIAYYKQKGSTLLNATDGGDGTAGFTSWNKGKKCNYIDKLINNSPNAKKVYSYTIDGDFLNEYNSIKKASIDTGAERSHIKNICELKKRYKSAKGLVFRYYKKEKIQVEFCSEDERLKRVREGKLKNARGVKIYDKSNNKEYVFNNYKECLETFSFKKSTLMTYLSQNKETKKFKFSYE